MTVELQPCLEATVVRLGNTSSCPRALDQCGSFSSATFFWLIFSVALLCDEKLLFFISKCGNLLVLRSTGLVCSGDPQSGEHSAFLAWGLGDGIESGTLSLQMSKIPQRGRLEDTRFTQQVAETHPFHFH